MNSPPPQAAGSPDGRIPENAYLGRQPIVDQKLRTIGYELLYRSGEVNTATFEDSTRATSTVLANLLLEFGVDRVVGSLPAWVNFPQTYLVQEMPIPLPPNSLVIEVLEDVQPTAEVLTALKRLVDDGYQLALDDFEFRPELLPLVEMAQCIKVDVRQRDPTQLRQLVEQLGKFRVSLVAEQVETMAQFEHCMSAGFEWFQGYFMLRPEVLVQRAPSPNRLALIRLLGEIHAENTDLRRIESLVSLDVALSYRLLRCLNSSLYALPRSVESIQQALVMLGLTRLRNLVTLLVLGRVSDKPSEVLTTALTRARTLELVSRRNSRLNPEAGFAVGLLSVLDVLLDVPMNRIVEEIPLAEELKDALVRRHGEYGRLLRGMEAHERGDLRGVLEAGLDPVILVRAWIVAIDWVNSMQQVLAEGRPATSANPARHSQTARPPVRTRNGGPRV